MPDKQKGNLYRRGKSWYVAVVIDGKLIRRSFGPDRNAAEAVLAELLKKRAIARATGEAWTGLEEIQKSKSKANITFAEVAEEYFQREKAGWKNSTVVTYRDILKCHLLPAFGRQRVRNISTADVAGFRTRLAERLSASRVNRIMTMLRLLLNMCVSEEIIRKNPAHGVRKLQQPNPDVDPLPHYELNKALAHIDQHFRPLFTCLAWTGARPNELLALRWSDLDFDRKEIRITKGRVRGVEGLPKTSSSQRVIPMLPPVEASLHELRSRPLAAVSGHVFLNKKGKPINKHLDRVWARALEDAELRHRPSYQLRHTFASLCIQQGIAPGWVAMVLGHTSMEMTFSRYARYIPEASAEHERKLLKLFQQPDAATEQQEITKEITAPFFDPSRKNEKPVKTRVSRRRNKKKGRRGDSNPRILKPQSSALTSWRRLPWRGESTPGCIIQNFDERTYFRLRNANNGGKTKPSTPPKPMAKIHDPIHIVIATLGPRSLIMTPTVAIQGTKSVITIIAVTA